MAIDLKLPEASILDHSTAYTPLLPGLHGNVHFSEWPHFDQLVTNISDAINQLSIDNFRRCKQFKPFVETMLDLFHSFRFDDPYPKAIKEHSTVNHLYEIICHTVRELVRHLEQSSCWFIHKSYYLQNAKEFWRSMGLGGLANSRDVQPLPKERMPDSTLKMPLGDRSNAPVCAFDFKGSSADILASHVFGSRESAGGAVPVSSKELCARYNTLFATNQDSKELTTTATELVAQALTYALSVASGCVFLFNYDVGVAFEVLKRDVDGSVHVRTSRPFYGGEEIGAVLAMVALSIHSIKRVKEDKGLPEYIQCPAETITKKSRDVQERMTSDERGVVTNENSECETNGVIINTGSGGENEERVSCDSSDAEVMGIMEARFLQRRDIIGCGHSGIVFEALWRDKRVAVKEWNGSIGDGLEVLVDEVSIVTSMRKECPSLFGDILPNVYLSWKASGKDHYGANEPMLVTEFVGETIYRDRDDRLFLGNGDSAELVNRTEELAICKAAVRALKTLHANGFYHGSVHLRNLRVTRGSRRTERDERAEASWRVWWIDFGRTARIRNEPQECYFLRGSANDIGECLELFHTREDDDDTGWLKD